MGEFRIGRKQAAHSYPDTGNKVPLPPFARNFAFGPATDEGVATTPGTDVLWSNIESGGGPSVNVPITPKVTGRLAIRATLMINSLVASSMTINVRIDGITTIAIPFSVPATPAGHLNVAVPLLVETNVTLSPHTIQIRCVAPGDDGNTLVANQCSVEIQELAGTAG